MKFMRYSLKFLAVQKVIIVPMYSIDVLHDKENRKYIIITNMKRKIIRQLID